MLQSAPRSAFRRCPSKQQAEELVQLLKNPPAGEESFLVELLTYRVPAGVDDAAKVKAGFLAEVAKGEEKCALVSRIKATELLGTMLGGSTSNR